MGSCPSALRRTQRGLAMGLDVTSLKVTICSREGCEVVWGSQKQGSFLHVKRQRCGLPEGSAYSQNVLEMPRVCPKCTWPRTCFPDPPAGWPGSCSQMRQHRAEAWAGVARGEDLSFIWNL